MDILTTPSMPKPKQDYSRTPGQVLSLISSLGFVSNQNFNLLWVLSWAVGSRVFIVHVMKELFVATLCLYTHKMCCKITLLERSS